MTKETKRKGRARRAKDASPMRVYTYGLPLGPTENAHAVEEQFRLARAYKNDIVTIERARREAYAAIVGEDCDISGLDERIAEMRAEANGIRAAAKHVSADARKRIDMPEPDRARLADLKGALATAYAERKVMRAALFDPRIARCDELAADMVKLFRKSCGLRPSGTYIKIEDAITQTRKGPPPKHGSWGLIAVQMTASARERAAGIVGLPVAALFDGSDRRLHVERAPQTRETNRPTRKHPDRVPRVVTIANSALLRMRIGGVPVAFPMIMHRALPEDGVIKWAWVQRKRAGSRWRWEFQIAVEAQTFVPMPREGHAVAVHFTAKGAEGDRRVAYALGTDGRTHALELPSTVTATDRDPREHPLEPFGDTRRRAGRTKYGTHDSLALTDKIRGHRDNHFHEAREALLVWLAANEAPEWLVEATRHAAKWKSPRRLLGHVYAWSRARFAGDETIFATLDAWRRRDRHLYQYEMGLRAKALARRREHARRWAAKLAREYAVLITDDSKLNRGRKNSAPEAKDASRDYTHRTSNEAAPGEARAAVRCAFAGRSDVVKAIPGLGTKCPACGSVAIAGDFSVVCTSCGAEINVDHARCWHLLREAEKDTGAVVRAWRNEVAAVAAMKGQG